MSGERTNQCPKLEGRGGVRDVDMSYDYHVTSDLSCQLTVITSRITALQKVYTLQY